MDLFLGLILLVFLIYALIKILKLIFKNHKKMTPVYDADTIATFQGKYSKGESSFEPNILCQLNAKQEGLQIISLGYSKKSMFVFYPEITVFERTTKLADAANFAGVQSETEYIVLRYIRDNEALHLIFYVDDPLIKIHNQRAAKKNDILYYVNMRISQ